MRSTLYLKFILIYIAFGFLSIFTVATLGSTLLATNLETKIGGELYKEANLMGKEYLPGFFTNTLSLNDTQVQLNGLTAYLHADVWITDRNGKLLLSSHSNPSTSSPAQITDFNPAEAGNEQYLIGNYHNYFSEEMITVIAPVTQGFYTKGYILIHKSYSDLTETKDSILNVVYITLLVIYILSFSILLGLHFFIYRPLRKITEAAKQYASGNLDHEIHINTDDEVGYLSASLNYMSNQLKDMNSYQKKFIANVSHDFRSPLTSIKGYLEAILDGTIPPELYEKYISRVISETERLHKLTESMLTLNSLDARGYLTRTNFDINRVIKDTAASFEGTCGKKNISFDLTFSDNIQMVYADMEKIQQVMYNLIDNAIKFSHNDSVIYIQAAGQYEKIFVSVKDTGIGIPKDSLKKIWERFYKTDLSRGKDKKGTGLGLSIVKEILQSHGENIDVISTEGVGTEFIFSLPRSTVL